MSSSSKYPSGLSKWVTSDKPEMDDFLNDNQLLDENAMWKAAYDPKADSQDTAGPVEAAGGIPAYTMPKHVYDVDGSVAAQGGIHAAVEAYVNAAIPDIARQILEQTYPIGSYYISERDTNPSELLGFGVWDRAAIGKMLVGVNANDGDFNAPGKTGGSKTAALPLGNSGGTQSVDISNTSYFNYNENSSKRWRATYSVGRTQSSVTYVDINWYTPLMGTTEQGSIMNPFETAYIWKRTQ